MPSSGTGWWKLKLEAGGVNDDEHGNGHKPSPSALEAVHRFHGNATCSISLAVLAASEQRQVIPLGRKML